MSKGKVVVGMSGGVDSSVAAWLLKEQGYDVIGVTMQIWQDEDNVVQEENGGCCGLSAVDDARRVAASIGIPYYVMNFKQEFQKNVIDYFTEEYLNGRTPNPCIACNRYVKWEALLQRSLSIGADYIATGHYSRLEERSGHIYIVAGDDDKKDQSYFLWRLGQDILKRCIFPLGDYTKIKVREYLAEKGYEAKSKEGESMEVCFIQGDYRDFLREQCPELDTEIGPGWFVNSEGVKLGQHKGAPYYTIGQRKGLEIALGKPAYVLKINPQKNTVMLGDAEQLQTEYMLAEQDRIVDEQELFSCENLAVRIRYRSRPIPCRVKRLEDGRLLVRFLETASAVAPGQSAVFYDGRRVLGGAFIASQRGIGLVIIENKDEL